MNRLVSGIAALRRRWHAPAAALVLFGLSAASSAQADWSVARKWNEQQLQAIRKDLARPTVTARNLYHVAACMYDA